MTGGEFNFPTVIASGRIHYDANALIIFGEPVWGAVITSVKIKVYFRGGKISFLMDLKGTNTFVEIPYTISGQTVTYNFVNGQYGADVRYRIVGEGGTVIYTPKNALGEILDAAITIQML